MYQRSSGLLCHITSLPGPHGIGDLGAGAREFVDFLADAGQHIWQVLPLGPAGAGNSPYDSRSSFAGNPLMISLTDLVEVGLLDPLDISDVPAFRQDRVEFRRVERWRMRHLRRAFERFQSGAVPELHAEYERFVASSADWLDDFALALALRDAHEDTPWYQWPEPLRLRDANALLVASTDLAAEIAFHTFVQFLFDFQWGRLKAYAKAHSIAIMGDIPIYVALDSADVWANQAQFLLDEDGQPTVQAGVPPDLFTADGQLWGNPVYDWDLMKRDDYRWWERRIQRLLELTDIVRIDHFRGFAAGWQVPADAETARTGEWVPGPGRAFFDTLQSRIGEMPIVVEDLGVITPDVEALRDGLGYPGMKVLQFAFGDDAANPYLPHNAVPNSMIYTGTHDNDTSRGWYESASEQERTMANRYLRTSERSIERDMLRAAWASVSVLACAPVQDVLGLGSEARMNIPGEARGNWSWRFDDMRGLRRRAAMLRDLTTLFGRNQSPLTGA